MKRLSEFFRVLVSLSIFLILAFALFWLWDPQIPGVHGVWNVVLYIAGSIGYWALVKWIMKSGKKKTADKAI